MATSYDVIVVGGGVVGAAAARELSREGRRVVVLDPDDERGQAWRAAAGMLAPQIEATESEALHELSVAGRDRYADLSPELLADTGVDIGLWREGIAQVATEPAQAELLRARVAQQRQQGQVSDWLDADEARSRWPWVRDLAGALWAPMDGALDPKALVHALLTDARNHGAETVHAEATAVVRTGDRVTGVMAGDEYSADDVIIAAGAWSGRIMGLPRPLSVEPVRGQMAAMPWPAEVPRAILYSDDCYVVARGEEAVVGSTMEYTGFDASVSDEGQQRIWTAIRKLCPPIGAARAHRTWAGLRPVTPDGLPIVGPAPDVEGLWYATGHGRNGVLLAGITALLLQQMLRGDPVHEHVLAMSPNRLWKW